MWTNQRHVTEQLDVHVADKLDLLDSNSQWRKDMGVVVAKFTELLPDMKDLLCSSGDIDDSDQLVEKFPRFNATLEEVILQLQLSLVELRQHKVEWESALKSRTGDIARLDQQVHNLFDQVLQSTRELESIQHTTEALEPFQLQVKQAEEELHQAQDKIRRLQDQEESLLQREKEFTERSQKFEDHRRAKERDLEDRKSDMDQAQAEHKKLLQQLQSREIAVGKTEDEQARAKISLEKTMLDMKSAHSVVKSLANVTETGLDSSLASLEALAGAVKERYSNLQEASNMKQQTLDQALQRNSGLEAELDSTMKTLCETNRLHTVQMNGYEHYKHRVFSLESKVSQLEKLQPMVNDLQLECAGLRDDNGTLDQSKKFLDQELTECRANKAKQEEELKKQLDEMAKANTKLTQNYATRTEQVQVLKAKQEEELKKQLDEMAKANTKLTQSYATLTEQVQVLKRQLDNMTEANTVLNRKIIDRDSKIRHADQVAVDRDAKIGEFENHVQYLNGMIQQLQAQLTTEQENAKVSRIELQTSRLEVEAGKKDYHTIVGDRDRIAQDNSMLSANLAKAIGINKKLAKSNDSLQSEHTNLKTQLADAQRSCIAKDDEIGRISHDNQLIKSENSDQVTSLLISLQEKSRELKNLQLSLEASHNENANMSSEVESLRRQRETLQSAAQRRSVQYQNDLDSQKQTVANKDDKIKRLENDLRSKDTMLQRLSKESDRLKELYGEIGGVRAGHGATRSDLPELEQALDEFVSNKNQEVHDLQQKLHEANRTLQHTVERLEGEKDKEASQINTRLIELREAYLAQANKYTAMEQDLLAKGNMIKTLQHQLTRAQAEMAGIGGFQPANIEDNNSSLGSGHGTGAQQDQQTSSVRNPADDTTPDLDLPTCPQIPGSLKRKAGDIGPDSNTERQGSGTGSCSNRQTPSADNLSTWAIADLRDPTYVYSKSSPTRRNPTYASKEFPRVGSKESRLD